MTPSQADNGIFHFTFQNSFGTVPVSHNSWAQNSGGSTIPSLIEKYVQFRYRAPEYFVGTPNAVYNYKRCRDRSDSHAGCRIIPRMFHAVLSVFRSSHNQRFHIPWHPTGISHVYMTCPEFYAVRFGWQF